MNLVGIGIDVVEIERIESSMQEFGERFLSRIFTENEQNYCDKQKRPMIHYAARFAAKEAIAKAFGTGIGKEIGWLDMQILRLPTGEPEVSLSGKAKDFAQKIGAHTVKVSLTHTHHYAAANAVVIKGD